MDKKFTETYGPWAVVTGASDGIGRAVAHELATRGLNLVLVARREDVLRTFAAELISECKIDARILALDLSVPDQNQELFAKTKDLPIGLYCGIAGFGTSGEFLKNDVARELNMLDLNCRAVVEQTHHFGNRFKAQKRGGIVLMSSILAWQGVPYSANYAATKAFIQSLAEGLQVEMKAHGIDVLAVAPGPTATGFGARARMKMTLTDDAATVGRNIVRHIGKSKLVRPGWVARALEAGLAAAPRALRVRLMGQSLAGMIEKQD